MVSIEKIAEMLSTLNLVDIKTLEEIMYRNYGIELNLNVDSYRIRETIRNESNNVESKAKAF